MRFLEKFWIQWAAVAIGGYLRFAHLSRPKSLVFDEVYYVEGARQLLKYGVEFNGSSSVFVVHPPIGKWVIASGIWLFGDNPFGWRFAVALLGTLSIVLTAKIASLLFDSPVAGSLAAILMALDGLSFVESRTALLDPILTFFILLAFYSALRFRKPLSTWITYLFLGLALGTKWSAIYFLLIYFIWDVFRSGFNLRNFTRNLLGSLSALAIYVMSWIGWFISPHGYDRNKSTNPFASLLAYHQEMWNFHIKLHDAHPYMAKAWTWLFLGRPTAFYFTQPKPPVGTCTFGKCADSILAIGTPILWWISIVAIIFSLYVLLVRRDHKVLLPLLLLGAGWLPWFFVGERTIFYFYAVLLSPWLVILTTYLFIKTVHLRIPRILIAISLIAIVLNFLFIFPILDAQPISYDEWYSRMWFRSWI